jgi:hypothetical protein
MTTVLEGYTTKEQSFVVLFCGQKDSIQRIFINNFFLFAVEIVCRVKWFTTESRNSLGRSIVADDARPGAEVAVT